jgi:phage shock protein E
MKAITAIMLFILPIFAFATESVWVDVRSSSEFDSGHLEAATNIPHGEIADKISALVDDKDAEVLLYCRSGNRAGIAQRTLEAEGYTNVKNIGSLNDARVYEAKRQQADSSVKPEQMM